MTQENLETYMRAIEFQKRDPQLLAADGPFCLRKLQEHLEELRDLLRIECDDIDKPELIKEEKLLSETVEELRAKLEKLSKSSL
jgi:hypothetical protein